MTDREILYKYRPYAARSLELLIRKEIYFASPDKLNDPYDCRVSIRAGLQEAIAKAREMKLPFLAEMLDKLALIDHVYAKMERDVSSTGIFSLGRDPASILMWAHYAGNHEGFCIGFRLPDRLTIHNEAEGIIGLAPVDYCKGNPFGYYFEKIVSDGRKPEWEDFWSALLAIGMTSKGESWVYEKETRIIRKTPGCVHFDAADICEIVFGLNMPQVQREVIRSVLSGPEWSHVQFAEIKRGSGFNIEKCSIA